MSPKPLFAPCTRPRVFAHDSRWTVGVLVVLTALILGGCASPDQTPPPVPVGSLRFQRRPDLRPRDKTLLVFLPGRGTAGKDFDRQRFLAALPPDAAADAVAVDLTYPYYERQVMVERLDKDIIVPARASGYRYIWLVGCSMGGLGAIAYDHDHPGVISGIAALGPFLGEKNIVAEIEAAGGLSRWQPHLPLASDDFQRRLWLAIREGRYGQPGHLPLVLGYGTQDRFAYGDRLLATNLAPDRVFRVFGFHDWATWHRLWQAVLASPMSPLAEQAALPPPRGRRGLRASPPASAATPAT